MSWGATRIPLEVEVKSLEPPVDVAADEAALYTGEWQVTFTPPPGPDSAGAPPTPPPTVLTVRYDEKGTLHASFPPGVFSPPPAPEPDTAALAKLSPQEREREEAKHHLREMDGGGFEYLLVPRARGVFMMGWMQDGVLLDVEELFHEFEIENGQAVRITVRNDEDKVVATGTRAAR
jgi:hypothetical protein